MNISTEETLELFDASSEADAEEEGDQVRAILKLSDSEDETAAEEGSSFKSGQDVGKIPKSAKQLANSAKTPNARSEPGVIYVGRIPHGFYEHEMRQYFSQFGPINRLRLSRNKKSGASKHFAFVEFAEADTAIIVAKTMDNYLLFGHILKCKPIPKELVRADLFKGGNKRFKKVPWNKIAGKHLEKPLSTSAWEGKIAQEKSRREKQVSKLASLGYEFESPILKGVPDVPKITNGDGLQTPEAATLQITTAGVAGATHTTEEPEDVGQTSTLGTKARKASGGRAKRQKAP